MGSRGINAEYMGKFSFPRLIVVPLYIHLLVEYISRQRSSNLFPSGCYIKTNAIQEQIAASHEFDGVRKEKERLTAASLNNRFFIFLEVVSNLLQWTTTRRERSGKTLMNQQQQLIENERKIAAAKKQEEKKRLGFKNYKL